MPSILLETDAGVISARTVGYDRYETGWGDFLVQGGVQTFYRHQDEMWRSSRPAHFAHSLPEFEGWKVVPSLKDVRDGDVLVCVDATSPGYADHANPEVSLRNKGKISLSCMIFGYSMQWVCYRRIKSIAQRIMPSSKFSEPLPLP